MKIKSVYIKTAAVIFFTASFFFQTAIVQAQDNGSVLHELVVKVIDDEWRVVHKQDESKSTIVVKRNDRISWTVEGSRVSMQFDPSLFGGNTWDVEDGDTFMRPVAPSARLGEYTYAVFIHSDQVFARGESPPRIIVE